MLLLYGRFVLLNINVNVGTRVSDTRVLEQSSIQKTIDKNTTIEVVTNLRETAGGVGCSESRERGYAMELELIKVEAGQEKGANIEEDVNHRPNTEDSNNIGDWLGSSAWHDMFLMKNQIPFFVIKRIRELVAGKSTGVELLRSKTAEFIEDILSHYPTAK